MHPSISIRGIFLLVLLGALAAPLCRATDPNGVGALTQTLDDMSQWVDQDKSNSGRWHAFLRTEQLRRELERGEAADPAVVARVLQQYQSGADGLDARRFLAVRSELQAWLRLLKSQYSDDLEKLAWASRGDHLPFSEERFEPIRAALRSAADRLQTALGRGSTFADGWNRYLKWDLLAGHLTGEAKLDSQALRDLDAVLKQFRANEPGLELPVFTDTAAALQRYRALVSWAALAQQTRDLKRRDTRSVYEKTMQGLQQQFRKHFEASTPETSWRLGRSLGLLRNLNQSPELIGAMRASLGQPNLFAEISKETINRLAQRPVSKRRPVRDVILGAQVRGWADTVGQLTFRTLPDAEHVVVEVRLEGNIQSRTVSFKKPVRVSSNGSTDFVATKRVMINDDQFATLGTSASAQTHTNIRTVRKMGGDFGRKFIERVAWKKVCEKKSRAEAEASRSAERQLAENFDQELGEALVAARHKYDQQLRPPLVRRGAFPEYLRMSSTDSSVQFEATLATIDQLSGDSLPPELSEGHDISVRLHQSTLDNYLPLALAGATISQDSEEQPPKLEGDIPPWLEKMSFARSTLKGASQVATKAREIIPVAFEEAVGQVAGEDAGESPNEDLKEKTEKESDETPQYEFRPWRIKLNGRRPVGVTLDNQQIIVRIRAAELQSGDGEEPFKNWDFIVTYQVLPDGDGILLRRAGKIEVFPTGFDPRWDKHRLSAKQTSLRNTIARNMNQRAEAGKGFPKEIPIESIRLSTQEGVEQQLVLGQLNCDDGWLTIGWRLP